MKFRYKVLVINIIFLSIALGFVGYFMIRKNFTLALSNQIKNAVIENNLIQSTIEYNILDIVNSKQNNISSQLSSQGERVEVGLISDDSSFYIRYGVEYVFDSDGNSSYIPLSLFDNLVIGSKEYIITLENEKHYIYVTSISNVNNKNLCIISKSNIEECYVLMNTQANYFRFLLVIVLIICSIFMYIASALLTHPMEQLNIISDEFAAGNYEARANVNTDDEIGLLSEKYNNMAISVSEHILELNDMIKRRDQFVADFTHEIKTPMTTIIGYADTMRSIELSHEDQMMSLNYIFSEGKRLEAMSMKLFDLIYLKDHDIEFNKINIDTLSSEIIKSMSPSLKGKNIVLKTNFESGYIYGDRELIKTVFINLIDNARKASSSKSEIYFKGYNEPDNKYTFAVKDNGCGMLKEDIDKICNEFYMVDKSRSRKEGGAGLGMSLSAVILEKHNATLKIESEINKGTTMYVTFEREVKNHEE